MEEILAKYATEWRRRVSENRLENERDHPPLISPDEHTESQWAARVTSGGFDEPFPPIDVDKMDKGFAYALQSLFVASPEALYELAGPFKEGTWTFDEKHHTLELPDFFYEERCEYTAFVSLHMCWPAVAKGRLFRGRNGLLIHNEDFDVKPRKLPDDSQLNLCDIHSRDSFDDCWQDVFDGCLGPYDLKLPWIESMQSIQPFFEHGNLPPYLTVSCHVESDQNLDKFPQNDFLLTFRREDDLLASTRVRWVGGIYSTPSVDSRLVFDWGDQEGSLGCSNSGNWSTDPPTRRSREEVEQEMSGPMTEFFMIFRRV
ncbi:uncharacterized protein J3D65DRAFT_666923 [Phyllosticta citribraziliensis]|uniref:Uncharacterized protein n=1 Tax=Phyllosticta citribraziliensis TaxID=989973 RepID=A0ABR1LUL5_9PEZI